MRRSKRIRNTMILALFGRIETVHSYIGPENIRPNQVSRGTKPFKIDTSVSFLKDPRILEQRLVSKDEEDAEPSSPLHSRDVSLHAVSIRSIHSESLLTPVSDEVTLSPLEAWCLAHLDLWYHQSQTMKCPFLRRRYGDLLDNVETIMKYTIIRRRCWSMMGIPQAWRPAGSNKKQQMIKYKNLSLTELRALVRNDWKPETGKGYYVSGKLTTACYRDDCLFTGPDPDMPIKGLRKYVGVAAHLFDVDTSRTTLHSLEVLDNSLEAQWELRGVLHLPWRPSLPRLSGRTVYHVDEEGLIYHHEEFWDLSVAYAFCFTLFPELAKRIWNDTETNSNATE